MKCPFKKEMCFFFDAFEPFKRTQYLGHIVVERLPLVRLLAWGEAFKDSNAAWLEQLGTLLRLELADLEEVERQTLRDKIHDGSATLRDIQMHGSYCDGCCLCSSGATDRMRALQ